MTAAVAQSGPHSRLPVIRTGSIYEGKFRDSTPSLRAAGKLTAASGDSAHSCLNPPRRPSSPEVVRKFHESEQLYTDPGKSRVFYGKAYDPHLKWAKDMTHGAKLQPSCLAGDLVNPPMKSLFRQKTIDKKESLYASHQKAPLAKSHDQAPGFPVSFPRDRITFGVKTVKDGNAGELVNPDLDHHQVMAMSEEGRELYRRTHTDLRPGEQHDRNYASGHFDRNSTFGLATPHYNDGKHTKRTMYWLTNDMLNKRTPITTRRVDAFRERTQHQLGKVHDPIKDTLHVGPDHTFGIMLKPDKYGVGDLMHYRLPDEYLRGHDRIRGVVAAMRQQLKKANYHNFPSLLDAFRHYDKNNTGRIDKSNLMEVCVQFKVPADEELVEALASNCIPDAKTGEIDYLSFINFLNWKDKMPAGLPERDIHTAPPVNHQPLAERYSPPLQAQIDRNVGEHRTSSAMIKATVGGVSSRGYRTYGIPTIRTDIAAPRCRRISDRVNYGDEGNTHALLNPSVFTQHGVTEKQFFEPRSKEELRRIFANIGVDMTLDTFDTLYDMAASIHPLGHVTVELFRNVLDEAHGAQLEQRQ